MVREQCKPCSVKTTLCQLRNGSHKFYRETCHDKITSLLIRFIIHIHFCSELITIGLVNDCTTSYVLIVSPLFRN